MLGILAGCNDTRLTFTQSGKGGPQTYLLTARECTWSNTEKGGCCLALTYQWDTHAGQFILEGVRSSYLRLVIWLPEALSSSGTGGEFQLKEGMVQGYDDEPDRGLCYTGGPGRISIRCDSENKVTGSFEVTCRGFLPGWQKTSPFSDDYILRARFDALPNATTTLRMSTDIGWFFATPQRRPVYQGKPAVGEE
ncbi:MAG: hypothetical protein JXQ73_23630 [Phycisphaerae bacterium]|nr:hypothetical protein [Phycisphaerae bacterium]